MKQLFRSLKSLWMKFASALGWVNTRVLLTIVYVVLIGIIALIIKLLRKDLLGTGPHPSRSYWRDKPPTDHTLESAKHQF